MNRDPEADKTKEAAGTRAQKRPYVKPAFEFDRAFETMALSCGKIQTGSSCKHVKKHS